MSILSFGIGNLTQLASALSSGNENWLEDLIEKKVEEVGGEVISDILNATSIGSALSAAQRARTAADTGGMSEIDRLERQLLSQFRLPSTPLSKFASKIDGFFRRALAGQKIGRAHRQKPWERAGTTRQEWIDRGWQHDWRSQPRNPAGGAFHWSGEWIPGRLTYPVGPVGKAPLSRKKRRLRKRHRMARAYGRKLARGMIKWNK